MENIISPDGTRRIVIYQYDTGSLGYSRVWWAITPENFTGIDLAKYELPDGYRTEGWTDQGVLQISQWKPYYGVREPVVIRSGDEFKGVKVQLIDNRSTYTLGRDLPVSGAKNQ